MKKENNGNPGIIYAPYVIGYHTEESSKSYDEFMKKYHKEHEVCPKCGEIGGSVTLMGYPLVRGKEDEYKDLNSYKCSHCGDVHTVHDRISKESFHQKTIRREYETYMKRVTDAFVDMQSDKIYGTMGTVETVESEVFYEVVWNGGLEYSFELNAGLYMSGVTYEEMKKYNAETALMYLKANALTYEEWVEQYKK